MPARMSEFQTFGGDEDLVAGDCGISDRFADVGFVFVQGGRVDVAIRRLRGPRGRIASCGLAGPKVIDRVPRPRPGDFAVRSLVVPKSVIEVISLIASYEGRLSQPSE